MAAVNSRWEPILADQLRIRALEAVFAIAADLERINGRETAMQLFDTSLLLAYLARYEPSSKWRVSAIGHLNCAIELLADGQESRILGLFNGVCGCGWIIEHISNLLSSDEHTEADGCQESEDDSVDEQDSRIDQFVLRALKARPWNGSYDLVSGLVGYGVYFLERLPVSSAASALQVILEILEKRSEVLYDGIAWHTAPERLHIDVRESYPCGYYDLSITNGSPGIVGFLAQVLNVGVEREVAKRLLDGAMQWLLVRRRNPARPSRYGVKYVPGMDEGDGPLGWCCGDLGIAAVMHQAMAHNSSEDWGIAVSDLLTRCLNRTPGTSRIDTPGLQYGAMGIAHVFNRLYQRTGDERLRIAARMWFDYGLTMRNQSGGIGGFSREGWPREPENAPVDYSFLTGAVGIALALLSAAEPVEAQWDRRLLLSDPVGPLRSR